MKKLVLIVTGSIAAVKTYDLIERLKQEGFWLGIILTESAQQWVPVKSLENLSNVTVYSEQHDFLNIQTLLRSTDITALVVTAASANFIKQLVYHDRPLTQFIHTHVHKPILIAPAMNVMMWQHPAVQRNIKILMRKGHYLMGPVSGKLSCGDEGYGRLLEPEFMTQEIINYLNQKKFISDNKNIVENSKIPATVSSTAKKILLMIQPGSDCVNSYALISALRLSGWDVTCVIDDEALSRVSIKSLATLSNHPVYHRHYQEDVQGMEHIRLSEHNDVLLIMAATPKNISAMAQGSADTFLECMYLASKKPVFLMPSLDPTQTPNPNDLKIVQDDGVTILSPDLSTGFQKNRIDDLVKNFNAQVLTQSC